jgi:hypothetical protein
VARLTAIDKKFLAKVIFPVNTSITGALFITNNVPVLQNHALFAMNNMQVAPNNVLFASNNVFPAINNASLVINNTLFVINNVQVVTNNTLFAQNNVLFGANDAWKIAQNTSKTAKNTHFTPFRRKIGKSGRESAMILPKNQAALVAEGRFLFGNEHFAKAPAIAVSDQCLVIAEAMRASLDSECFQLKTCDWNYPRELSHFQPDWPQRIWRETDAGRSNCKNKKFFLRILR